MSAILACALSGYADPVLYDNHTPNNAMAMATGTNPSGLEIETADDFVLGATSHLTAGTFSGLIVNSDAAHISGVQIEIYRVFPLDSTNPPSNHVPTRVNSPSDVAFDSRSVTDGNLGFSLTTLAASFTASNSIQPGGIHPLPNSSTGGNGAVTGTEVQFNFTLSSSLTLPAGHYFFVPQVDFSNAGNFYWLSASRPITGAGGTTPISPDLQVWTRDSNLAPDWLRVGTDIVGGTTPPTFNAAFSLNGTADVVAVPEGGATLTLFGLALCGLAAARRWFGAAA